MKIYQLKKSLCQIEMLYFQSQSSPGSLSPQDASSSQQDRNRGGGGGGGTSLPISDNNVSTTAPSQQEEDAGFDEAAVLGVPVPSSAVVQQWSGNTAAVEGEEVTETEDINVRESIFHYLLGRHFLTHYYFYFHRSDGRCSGDRSWRRRRRRRLLLPSRCRDRPATECQGQADRRKAEAEPTPPTPRRRHLFLLLGRRRGRSGGDQQIDREDVAGVSRAAAAAAAAATTTTS